MNNGTKNTREKMDFSELEQTIDRLHEIAGDPTDVPPSLQQRKACETAAKYLEWLSEKQENNRLYHKKQNLKKRELERAAMKMLSADELKEIERQVTRRLEGPSLVDVEGEE